jgi:AcrR family transcriptional regulator
MKQDAPALREPRQNRSRRTLTRIVTAARKILIDSGVDAVTVQAVVAKAGASVGSFYARFSGKEDLLTHLQEVVWADVDGWWEEALAKPHWALLSLPDSCEQIVRLVGESRNAFADERRALAARPDGRAAERRFQLRILESLTSSMLSNAREISHPDPGLAVDLALRAVIGVLNGDDEAWASAAFGAEAREKELVRLVVVYLGSAPPGADPTSQPPTPQPPQGVDYFDVWG